MAKIGVQIELEGAPQYKESMANLTAQTKLYQAQVKSLSAQMNSGVSAFTKSITTQKALQQQLEAQQNQLKGVEEAITKATEKYGEDSTQVIRLKTQYENLTAAIATTSQELQAQGGLAGAIGAEFEAIGTKMQAVGEKIGSLGDSLTQKITVPLAAIGTASVKTAADFDKSMSQVAATMGYTVDELNDGSSEASQTMQQLSDFAQEMGKTTAFSASEAAEALNYMALAGYSAEESMNMLPTVLNLAAAGSIDLAAASDMVTDAQSALGLSADETVKMVDEMAKASSKSNTSVAQLGEAMLTIGATAANMSGGTSELATALGVLADNGIKGAEGGTKLRNMILSLQDAAKDGAVDFGEFSVAVYDSEGNMRGITDIMQDISANMQGMTQEAKDAITSGIFNKQDLAGVNAMLQTSSSRFDELKSSIEDSEGAAQAMADVQLDNLSGQITLLKSALEGMAIQIGEILMPYIQQFVEKLQLLVDWFTNLDSGTQETIIKIGALVAAIGPALSIIGRIVSFGGTIISAVGKVVAFMPTVISAVTAVGAVLTGTIIPAIAGVVAAIIPFLPIIAAVAAAIAAVILVVKNWGAITDWISEKWTEASEFLSNLTAELGEFLSTKWQETTQFISDVITAIVEFFTEKANQIQAFLTEHLGFLGQLYSAKIEYIKLIIRTAVELIKTIIKAAGEVIKAISKGDWDKVGSIIKEAWAHIKETINNYTDNVKKIIANMLQNIVDKFNDLKSSAWNWGKDFVQNFVDGITSRMNALLDTVRSMAENIRSYLHFSSPDIGPLKDANQWPKDFVSQYAKGIEDSQYLIKNAVGDVAADIAVLANPFDSDSMYDAIRSGASDATIRLAIGDREFSRALRDMGVVFSG